MKHVSKLLALFLMAIALQNCTQKDEVNPSKEKVSFGFDLSAASSGRITSSSFEGTKIRMTIRKSTGETLLDMQPVDLITMGGSIISVPVELPVGDYKVTDFVLVNTSGVVTHATPKTGSIMAPLVQNVLERNFSVSASSANHVPMEVIEIANYAAGDFGYATFNLAVVHPLKIAVYTPAPGGGWKLARADAFVMAGTDTTLQRYKLLAKTDIISFNLDPDSTYTLLLKKNAYARYSMPFNYHHLIDSLNGQPLKLYLTPAFTFSVDDDDLEGYFEGPAGSEIIVDWGDGSSTPYTLEGEGISAAYNHSYTSTGNYFITITGDISTVTGFYSYYGFNVIKEINFDFLPELKSLRFGFNGYGPKVIDLTYNTKLIGVDVSIQRNMGSLLLPTINNISFIDVSGANKLTSAKLIVIIDRVYNAAVENNTHDGAFFLIKSLENGKGEMLRPLTPEALAKLRELRDVYGWFIDPNP